MKHLLKLFVLLIVVSVLFMDFNVYAYRKVISGVPYIHQVLDMDQSKFNGHNACGPTSAVMMVKFHHLQPDPGCAYPGWYVYNGYVGFNDKSGQNYDGFNDDGLKENDEWARDYDPFSDVNHHPHEVYGAHGFIVCNSNTDDNPYWGAKESEIYAYLTNHGLVVRQQNINIFSIIKKNIDAGLPLVGHSAIHRGTLAVTHYLVIVGYDTGDKNDEQKVVVYDPYGDACSTNWNGSARGIGVDYFLNGYCPNSSTRHTEIDWVYEIHPIGIYNWFPGWLSDVFPQNSQPFVDAYNNNGGENVLGIPWNNGSGGPWVHMWPGGYSDENTIFLQDFIKNGHWYQLVLNQRLKKVFIVHGQILTFWHNNYGYLNYGEPRCNEYYAWDTINGHKIVVQEFEKNNDVHYLVYDTVTRLSQEYDCFRITTEDDSQAVSIAMADNNISTNISLPIPTSYYVSAPSESTIFVMWDALEYKSEYEPYTLAYQTYRDGNPYNITRGHNYFYDTGLAPQEAHCYKTRAVLLDNNNNIKYSSNFTPQLCLATKPPRPVAKFEIDTSQNPKLDILRPVIFKNTSTGTNIIYSWDFGDNQSSTEKNPQHCFRQAGEYTVKLRIQDSYNRTSEIEKKINIIDLPPRKPETPRIEK